MLSIILVLEPTVCFHSSEVLERGEKDWESDLGSQDSMNIGTNPTVNDEGPMMHTRPGNFVSA